MLNLKISKNLKKCAVSYIYSFEKPITRARWTKRSRKMRSYNSTFMNVENSLLNGNKTEFVVWDLWIDFCSTQKPEKINGFHIKWCKGVFEHRDHSAVDMLFLFLAAFTDWENGHSGEKKLTSVHRMYWDLENHLKFKLCGLIGFRVCSYALKENPQKLKKVAKDRFSNSEAPKQFFFVLYARTCYEKRKNIWVA